MFGLAESRCGIRKPLEAAFGRETADNVLALARYAVSQGKSLSRAGDLLESHGMGALGLSSQRVSEVLAGLTPDKVNTFLDSWLKRCGKGESCLFDITSISTYGSHNTLAEWGYNRDRESLEQVNLALMTSVESGLPLWYTVLPGSMSDRTVMEYVLGMLGKPGMPDFVFYGDRGFYGEANIAMLKKNKVKYVIPVPSTVGWQKELIAENRDKLVSPSNLIECVDGNVLYGMAVTRKDGNLQLPHAQRRGAELRRPEKRHRPQAHEEPQRPHHRGEDIRHVCRTGAEMPTAEGRQQDTAEGKEVLV